MGKAIAIFNQKGGVGKTTTNINLAACLANRGKKVLMVDIDPQGNTTSGIGIRKRTLKVTLYDALIDKNFDVKKAILPTNTENLFIIPASVDLAGAEVELAQMEGREGRLKRVIDAVKNDYDFILVDCPPSLGILTINSLTADDIVASINYSQLQSGDVGIFNLPIEISSKDRNVYFRVERQNPPEIPVTVYAVN